MPISQASVFVANPHCHATNTSPVESLQLEFQHKKLGHVLCKGPMSYMNEFCHKYGCGTSHI